MSDLLEFTCPQPGCGEIVTTERVVQRCGRCGCAAPSYATRRTFAATPDPVNSPSHYTRGGIEVRDFVAAKGLNWNRGNVVKYVTRAGHKDPAKELEDLEKARSCLDHEIEQVRSRSR